MATAVTVLESNKTIEDETTLSPIRITCKGVSHIVKDRRSKADKFLLRNVNAFMEPGELTALMGPSGSGKTTLMDLLAGRKTTGKFEGSVLFAGVKPSQQFLRRHSAYVEQFDTLLGILSVEEMLMYTAELKRPLKEPLARKKAEVQELIHRLGLEQCRGVRIGSASMKGISGGQAKRVNIGISLITNPKILFLDEPTTGLDSYTANEVMVLVKGITHERGITACTTIHSPTAFAFSLLDRVLMLVAGRTVYFGLRGMSAIQHFLDATPKSVLGETETMRMLASAREWLQDMHLRNDQAHNKGGNAALPAAHRGTARVGAGAQDSSAALSSGAEANANDTLPTHPHAVDQQQKHQDQDQDQHHPLTAKAMVAAGAGGGVEDGAQASEGISQHTHQRTSASGASDDYTVDGSGRHVVRVQFNESEFITDLVTNADRKGAGAALADAYEGSALAASNLAQLDRYIEESSTTPLPSDLAEDFAVKRSTTTPAWWGLWVYAKYRTSRNYRDPMFLIPRFMDKATISLLIMTLYLGIGDNFASDNIINISAILFMWTATTGFVAASYIPALFLERGLFVRERNDGLYLVPTYLTAKLFDELVVNAIASLAICAFTFYGIDFQGSFGVFYVTYFASVCVGIVAAYFVAAIAPTLDAANALLPIYGVTLMLFAGFLIRLHDMPPWWKWYSYINFARYGWASVMVNQFGNYDKPWIGNQSVLQYYDLDGVSSWTYIGYIALFFIFFYCATLCALTFKRYQLR